MAAGPQSGEGRLNFECSLPQNPASPSADLPFPSPKLLICNVFCRYITCLKIPLSDFVTFDIVAAFTSP